MVCKIDIFPVCLPQRKSVGKTSLLKGAKSYIQKTNIFSKGPSVPHQNPRKHPLPTSPNPSDQPTLVSVLQIPQKKHLSNNIHHQHDDQPSTESTHQLPIEEKRSVGKFWGKSQGNYNTPLEHIPTKNPLKKLWNVTTKITSMHWWLSRHPPKVPILMM